MRSQISMHLFSPVNVFSNILMFFIDQVIILVCLSYIRKSMEKFALGEKTGKFFVEQCLHYKHRQNERSTTIENASSDLFQ